MNASRGLFQVSMHGVLRKQEVSSDMSRVLKTTQKLTAELDMKKYKNIVTPDYIKSEKYASNEAIKGLKEYIKKLDEPLPSSKIEEQIYCVLCKQVFTSELEKSKHFRLVHCTKYKC